MTDSPGLAATPGRPRKGAVRFIIGVFLLCLAAAAWFWITQPPAVPTPAEWDPIAGVLAGDGVAGSNDGPASEARFTSPFGVAVMDDGTVLVSDAAPDAHRIRRVTREGVVGTLAGSGPGYADGADARFNMPSGIAVGQGGTVYIADTGNNMVRRIGRDGQVATVAGGLESGSRDGPAPEARFNGPIGIAVSPDGRIIIADTCNDRIRSISPEGVVTTLAGSVQGLADGAAPDARFDSPSGVAADRAGNIYVADTGNDLVRMISPEGIVSTVEPVPEPGLFRPVGIAVGEEGSLFVSDERGRVVELAPGSPGRVLAGAHPGFADGRGRDARFRALAGLATAGKRMLLVADPRNALVRFVRDRHWSDLLPPTSPRIHPAFDAGAFDRAPLLWPVDPMEGPHEIAGTLGESRGGEGSERFHAGLDVRANEGAVVRAVRTGTITSPISVAEFGTLNESVRIGPVAYVHLRVGRQRDGTLLDDRRFVPAYDETGRLSSVRVRRGARFATGEPIGTVNAFNHVHVNVGWPGEELNPLGFRLLNFQDTVPPTIPRGGVRLFDTAGLPLTERRQGRLVVSGPVRIVVDAWDQVNGNLPRRRLGLYRLGYQVLHPDGRPVPGFERPRETIRFDRLAGDADAPRVVYATGSGIPFYGRRTTHFLYVVTNGLRAGVSSAGAWDASSLEPGNYVLRILAADASGNEAVANRDVAITVGSTR